MSDRKRTPLDALRENVQRCGLEHGFITEIPADEPVDEFVVIVNTPGYLPNDNDPATFSDYSDAVAYLNERVARHVEWLEDDLEGENEGHTVQVEYGLASSSNLSATYVTTTRPHDLGLWFAVERLEQ